jgi:hypothetical protein
VDLVHAPEYKALTIVGGRCIALDVAKHVGEEYQNKEAFFRNELLKIQIPWEEGHVR